MLFQSCDKLSSRLEWENFGGDFDRYEAALYAVFKRDFISDKPVFHGKPVDIIHEKYYHEKERSFWHIVTSGAEDFKRSFDADRCASLPWVKGLIHDDGTCCEYKTWSKWHDKTKKDRWYIWCTTVSYMVVLEDRGDYFKLITAFNVFPYHEKTYEKEYAQYKTKTST